MFKDWFVIKGEVSCTSLYCSGFQELTFRVGNKNVYSAAIVFQAYLTLLGVWLECKDTRSSIYLIHCHEEVMMYQIRIVYPIYCHYKMLEWY